MLSKIAVAEALLKSYQACGRIDAPSTGVVGLVTTPVTPTPIAPPVYMPPPVVEPFVEAPIVTTPVPQAPHCHERRRAWRWRRDRAGGRNNRLAAQSRPVTEPQR